jgi:hypothetical protein
MSDNEMRRALEADGEKLRMMTGQDHGPFPETQPGDTGYPFQIAIDSLKKLNTLTCDLARSEHENAVLSEENGAVHRMNGDLAAAVGYLRAEMLAAIGHMENARIDLGCSTKRAAEANLAAGIGRARAALEQTAPEPATSGENISEDHQPPRDQYGLEIKY